MVEVDLPGDALPVTTPRVVGTRRMALTSLREAGLGFTVGHQHRDPFPPPFFAIGKVLRLLEHRLTPWFNTEPAEGKSLRAPTVEPSDKVAAIPPLFYLFFPVPLKPVLYGGTARLGGDSAFERCTPNQTSRPSLAVRRRRS